ncbi:Protein RTF2 [Orchesella cincta]|uniref:Replication termination factor 2 n=1 Tax=Orchesella cincta TaxID=48709 RepID=A0A1D2MT22_ORCCI|nr:Protein RTF2 [Orchesella cincta]
MGCDGGTIPKRDELVRTKKKPEQKDKNSERAFRWKHCAITQQRLQKPVVSCELGRLYNKEAVLETLLNKAEVTPDVAAHIRTLRDVKELQLTANPMSSEASSSSAEVGDGYIDVQKSKWICPISGQEMNGTFKFSFIWSCGCVLSDKALKEMRKANAETSECLRCQKPFNFEDVIIMNPTDEEEKERQVEKMNTRRLLAKKNKKSSKKREAEVEAASGSSKATAPEDGLDGDVKVKSEPNKVVNGGASSSNGRVAPKSNGDIAVPVKKSKLSSEAAGSSAAAEKKVKDYSVAKDPNASETYKSLFTTHSTAQTQQKAHWVTYNPFYN